jgi:hypothetical protein
MAIKNTKDICYALSMTLNASASDASIVNPNITRIKNTDHRPFKSVIHNAQDSEETDSTVDEGRKNKFPTPKFEMKQKKLALTEEEQLQLHRQYLMEKSALHEFKELKRAEGIDVSRFDIKLIGNKLDYSLIPSQYRSEFKEFIRWGSITHNRKRRTGIHSFMSKLQKNNSTARKSKATSFFQSLPPFNTNPLKLRR